MNTLFFYRSSVKVIAVMAAICLCVGMFAYSSAFAQTSGVTASSTPEAIVNNGGDTSSSTSSQGQESNETTATSSDTEESEAAAEEHTLPQCSEFLTEGIVISQETVLFSHDEGGAFIPQEDHAVPAGYYDVTLVSFDFHSENAWDTFTNETWFVRGFVEGQSDPEFVSEPIADLPDDVDSLVQTVNTNVHLPNGLDSIDWVHNALVDPDYQSIHPLCVQFLPVEAPAEEEESEEEPELVLPECSDFFDEADGQIIRQTQVLLSHDEGGAIIRSDEFSVASGTYDVFAVTFDFHIEHAWDTLTDETWLVNGYEDGVTEPVFTSDIVPDLADGINSSIHQIGDDETFPNGLDEIEWRHNALVNLDYQSIHPLCLQFVDASTSTPEVIPEENPTSTATSTPEEETSGGGGSSDNGTEEVVAEEPSQTSSGSRTNRGSNDVSNTAAPAPLVAGTSTSNPPPAPLTLGEQVSIVPNGGAGTGSGGATTADMMLVYALLFTTLLVVSSMRTRTDG